MAGSGVALRLHEFRESQEDSQDALTAKPSRLGRDVHGLYPGQLGRVHSVHAKDCGSDLHSRRSRSIHESPGAPSDDYRQSFDVRTLRALTVLRHGPAAPGQRPPQTSYEEQFGLQAPLFPQ